MNGEPSTLVGPSFLSHLPNKVFGIQTISPLRQAPVYCFDWLPRKTEGRAFSAELAAQLAWTSQRGKQQAQQLRLRMMMRMRSRR